MPTGFKLNKIYKNGYCTGRGAFADRSLSLKKVRFYTRCFLLEHPEKGLILIDTGYGTALTEATKKGIYSLYRKLVPFSFSYEDCIERLLAQDGIAISDISYLIITHFHPDHIGGLSKFAQVPWIYRKDSLETLSKFSSFKGLTKGFIKPLVPPTPEKSIAISSQSFDQNWNSFSMCDVFGDKSLYLINLPGHSLGQMGVVIENTFFVADAKWVEHGRPNKFGLCLQENPKDYLHTLKLIDNLDESIQIYPTHTIEEINE